MSLINFRNGFFLTLGFSLGYMKAVHDNEELISALKTIKEDPEFREKFNELVDGFKEAIAGAETSDDIDEEKLDSLFDIDSTIPTDRKFEIYKATTENPVTLHRDEIDQMNLNKVKVGLGANRYILHEDVAESPEHHEMYIQHRDERRAELGLDPIVDEPKQD
jgi:hypothetical protein